MGRFGKFRLVGVLVSLTVLLVACVPGFGPQLRVIHGQTWGSNFNVQITPVGATTITLPVTLEFTFTQRLNNVTADASLAYNIAIFRLNTGDLTLTGRLGVDDSLYLSNSNDLLQFDGNFVGDQLRGTVSIAGLVPVGNVTFTRIR